MAIEYLIKLYYLLMHGKTVIWLLVRCSEDCEIQSTPVKKK